MSDYTPTTEQVRMGYASNEFRYRGTPVVYSHDQFNRWLAAHDAEIRADEREKAAQRVAAYADAEGIGLKSWDAAIAAARGEDAFEEPLYPDDWGDK